MPRAAPAAHTVRFAFTIPTGGFVTGGSSTSTPPPASNATDPTDVTLLSLPTAPKPTRLLAAIVTTSAGGPITGGDTTFYSSPLGRFETAPADAMVLSLPHYLVHSGHPTTFTARRHGFGHSPE
jgi:hypothetical protein